jgi:hypothetical protein
VADYHINSDEPSVLDYNTDFKSAGQIVSLYAPDQFRISDHDPVMVGLNLTNTPPTASAEGPYTVYEGETITLTAKGVDPDGTKVTFAWDLDNNGTFETPGQTVSFLGINPPTQYTVNVQVTDGTGQTNTATTTVEVLFNWGGFSAPIKNEVFNPVSSGQSIPVKFSLGGNKGLAIFATKPISQQVDCVAKAPSGNIVEIQGKLSYDPATNLYTFGWKTDKGWLGTCRQLTLTLTDGTVQTAFFSFK